jgi:hypothetical protein
MIRPHRYGAGILAMAFIATSILGYVAARQALSWKDRATQPLDDKMSRSGRAWPPLTSSEQERPDSDSKSKGGPHLHQGGLPNVRVPPSRRASSDPSDRRAEMAFEAASLAALRQARLCIRQLPSEIPAILVYRLHVSVSAEALVIDRPTFVRTARGSYPSGEFVECLQSGLQTERRVRLGDRLSDAHQEGLDKEVEVFVPTRFTNDGESGMSALLEELRHRDE